MEAVNVEKIEEPDRTRENPARELLSMLWRGRLTLGVVSVLVTGVVTLGVLCTPPQFEAESSLLVRIGREYVYRSEIGRSDATRIPSLAEMVNSEVEILSSLDLAEQVVRTLGVDKLYPELAALEPDPELAVKKAVLSFRQATSVRPVLDSSIVKVGFANEEPQLAADAVNLLVDRFREKHVEVFGEELLSGLQAQLETRTAELAEAEQALANFKRQSNLFDLDEQKRLLLGQRARLEDELRACVLELGVLGPAAPEHDESPCGLELPPDLSPEMKGELLRQRGEIERELRAPDPAASDRQVDEASVRLLDLRLEESRLLRDYSASSRRVQEVRAEIEHVQVFLGEAEHGAAGMDETRRRERAARTEALRAESARLEGEIEALVRADLQRQRQEERERVRALEAQRDDHERRLLEMDADLQALDERAQTLRQLERELASAEAAVENYARRVDDARVGAELDREKQINVRVVERASTPVVPLGLPRALKLGLGAFVGLIAGAGAAVLLDLLRGR